MSARGDPSPSEYRLARVRCAGNSPTTRTRLCEVANGGQTVVTSQTASLVGQALLAGSSVHDPGIHHLRDVSPSERVFELRDCRRSRQEPQQLRSLDTHPNDLPT